MRAVAQAVWTGLVSAVSSFVDAFSAERKRQAEAVQAAAGQVRQEVEQLSAAAHARPRARIDTPAYPPPVARGAPPAGSTATPSTEGSAGAARSTAADTGPKEDG